MKHTSGPWFQGPTWRDIQAEDPLTPGSPWEIATVHGSVGHQDAPDDQSKANSARIVYCVNAFEEGGIVAELVAACQAAEGELDAWQKEIERLVPPNWGAKREPRTAVTLRIVSSALARFKEESHGMDALPRDAVPRPPAK